MKPQITLERSVTPDGKEIILYERDGVLTIRVNGMELMSSRAHGSEEAMATFVLADLRATRPHILVGGLGMGYTTRAVLDNLPAKGRVTVTELLPVVVTWNRRHLGHLAGSPLDDPRVCLKQDDVARVMVANPLTFDAVMLDVDNGPAALTDIRNEQLYNAKGLATARRCLRPGGVLAVWSASPDHAFERALGKAGFRVRIETVRARKGAKGPKHTIFIAKIN
jgi:spermidine synthase